MINIVVELSKYVILTLMIVYTVSCAYYLVVAETRFRQERTFKKSDHFNLSSGFYRICCDLF